MTLRFKRLLLLGLALVLAVYVLWFSYPRLVSSLRYLPVETALERNWGDYPIPQRQFPILIGIAKTAIQTLDHARYWQGLAWLYYIQAYDLGFDTKQGQILLTHSEEAFGVSLSKSPADPASWLRLAWVRYLLNDDSERVIKALKMSFYTGRAERYLMLDRLGLALRVTSQFEPQDISLVRDQVQLSWRFYPEDVLNYMGEGVLDKHNMLGVIVRGYQDLYSEIEGKL